MMVVVVTVSLAMFPAGVGELLCLSGDGLNQLIFENRSAPLGVYAACARRYSLGYCQGEYNTGGRGAAGQDPTPRRGVGGGGSTDPKMVVTMGSVGARGAGDFFSGIRQGEIFLFYPLCLYSK